MDLCVDSLTPVGGDCLGVLSCTELKCYTQSAMKQPQLHAYIDLALSGPIHMKKCVCTYVYTYVDAFSVDLLRDV